MFTIMKLFWLGVILFSVWNVFRVIEKRKKLNAGSGNAGSGNAGSGTKPGEANDHNAAENDPLPTKYCDICASFVTKQGCDRPDCGMSDISNG